MFYLYNNINSNISDTIYAMAFKHFGRHMHGYALHAHARVDDLDLDASSQWLRRGTNSTFNYLDN